MYSWLGNYRHDLFVLPDALHAYLGLGGLSLLGEEGVLPMHAALNISQRASNHLHSLHSKWKNWWYSIVDFNYTRNKFFCDYSFSPAIVYVGLGFWIFLYCTVRCCSVLSLPNVLPIRHCILYWSQMPLQDLTLL